MADTEALLHVFIDSNVLLSFFEYTDDDLNAVRTVIEGLKENRIQPYVNRQLYDEVRRNREVKLKGALDKLKEQRLDIKFPALCSGIELLDDLKKLQKDYSKRHGELVATLHDQISKRTLLADQVLDEFFACGEIAEITDEIVERARKRVDLNNPPRKTNSIGDSIHWEWLLEVVPPFENLYIISGDGDFASELITSNINKYLESEWDEKKSGQATLYKSLGEFFRAELPDVRLPTDFRKRSLIDQLRNSANFAQTHNIVAGLHKVASLTSDDVEEILRICLENTQVRWIITDDDVRDFISSLLLFYDGDINPELVEDVQHAIEEKEGEEAGYDSFEDD